MGSAAVIVLDTHAWIWWTHDESRLAAEQIAAIQENETNGVGVSAISCWEIAKLVEYDRLDLPIPLEQWFEIALNYPGTSLLALTPEIAIESTRLPDTFHRDPADQIIVATARIYDCSLITSDKRIRAFTHVRTI